METPLPTTAPDATPPAPPAPPTLRKRAMDAILSGLALICLFTIVISSVCFLVSGIVFTVQEYENIPTCAEPYKAWMITILVLIVIAGGKNNDSTKGPSDAKELGYTLIAWAILSGLVAGLGSSMVLYYPDKRCDISGIHQLVAWTEWFLIFCACPAAILPVAGLAFVYMR